MRPGILLAVCLFLIPAAVHAQSLPPDIDKSLWCGAALQIAGESTGDAETSALARRGAALVGEAKIALMALGYSEGQVKGFEEKAHASAGEKLRRGRGDQTFSYEECLQLEEEPQ